LEDALGDAGEDALSIPSPTPVVFQLRKKMYGFFTNPNNLQKDIDVSECFLHQICIFSRCVFDIFSA
jgi:hypothetical protein